MLHTNLVTKLASIAIMNTITVILRNLVYKICYYQTC